MRVVIAPPVPALLPSYASVVDPVAELRTACLSAVAWLTEGGPARVVAADELGLRVGRELLGAGSPYARSSLAGYSTSEPLLVMANGSARRSEKAPGHLDERSSGFDEGVERALAQGDAAALGELDLALADELLTAGVPLLRDLADLSVVEASMDYADDPFGVRYWVVRWRCES
jgi:hypothetical protein